MKAAKLQNCERIIGIDRYPARLKLAKELGATHVINTADSNIELVKEIKSLTNNNGASIVIDTTGNLKLIGDGMDFTANRGQMVILGVPPPEALLNVHLITFMQASGHDILLVES